ncbi:MAG: hypothetical protein J1F36_05760 [Clostridiales bacterium]|nr:hypothetical protein [Clostridiales bacterium]
MTDDVVEIIAQYGLETILIAVMVNILTALIKTPIKYFASKTKHSTRITRFIVILPIVLGFAITLCYRKFLLCDLSFGKEFVTLWLTSSSLSLTIYAVMEKMLPSKKSILQDSETEMTEKIIGRLQSIADGVFKNETTNKQENDALATDTDLNNEDQQSSSVETEQQLVKKIVLRGNNHVQDESKE